MVAGFGSLHNHSIFKKRNFEGTIIIMSCEMADNLSRVKRKLEKPFRLRPQESTDSLDSGINSRNPSSSSLRHDYDLPLDGYHPLMDSLGEYGIATQSHTSLDTSDTVQINVVDEDTDESSELKPERKPSVHHLDISLPPTRKDSTGSCASTNDYKTPPTSPIFTVTKNIPINAPSNSSPAEEPEEISVTVEIKFLSSGGDDKVRVNVAKLHQKLLGQLQLNFFFTPNSPPPRSRSYSSPTSTPNSPILSSKKSRSVDIETPPASPSPTPTSRDGHRQRNDLIASIVRRNMVEFVDSTDFESLAAHLYQENVLSHKDMEVFEGIKSPRGKNNYFYMLLLDTKGVNAYQKLYDCLKKETHHIGHKDLVKTIKCGLTQVDCDDTLM